jgi:hypothetical protein
MCHFRVLLLFSTESFMLPVKKDSKISVQETLLHEKTFIYVACLTLNKQQITATSYKPGAAT